MVWELKQDERVVYVSVYDQEPNRVIRGRVHAVPERCHADSRVCIVDDRQQRNGVPEYHYALRSDFWDGGEEDEVREVGMWCRPEDEKRLAERLRRAKASALLGAASCALRGAFKVCPNGFEELLRGMLMKLRDAGVIGGAVPAVQQPVASEALVETAARAGHATGVPRHGVPWDMSPQSIQDEWRRAMRAALTAVSPLVTWRGPEEHPPEGVDCVVEMAEAFPEHVDITVYRERRWDGRDLLTLGIGRWVQKPSIPGVEGPVPAGWWVAGRGFIAHLSCNYPTRCRRWAPVLLEGQAAEGLLAPVQQPVEGGRP